MYVHVLCVCVVWLRCVLNEQEMERVARETMDKAMSYQNELEQQKSAGQKQVRDARPLTTIVHM